METINDYSKTINTQLTTSNSNSTSSQSDLIPQIRQFSMKRHSSPAIIGLKSSLFNRLSTIRKKDKPQKSAKLLKCAANKRAWFINNANSLESYKISTKKTSLYWEIDEFQRKINDIQIHKKRSFIETTKYRKPLGTIVKNNESEIRVFCTTNEINV